MRVLTGKDENGTTGLGVTFCSVKMDREVDPRFEAPMIIRKLAVLAAVLFFVCALLSAQTASMPTKTVAERLGYPANTRLLMIHADDFGMSHSVNRATIEALEKHWITSASIMVPCPWFSEVARWAKEHPEADLGIHVTLNADWTGYRWTPVSPQPKNSSLLDADGYLPLTTEYVVAHAKMTDVETEGQAQIDKAMADGIKLSHLDTHMGTIVSSPDLLKVYIALGGKYKLPVMLLNRRTESVGITRAATIPPELPVLLDEMVQIMPGVKSSDWLNEYKKQLAALPPGVYQLTVHLGHNDEELQGMTWDHLDWGAEWRQNDYDVVSNPEFQKFIKDQGFVLVTWKDLSKAIAQDN